MIIPHDAIYLGVLDDTQSPNPSGWLTPPTITNTAVNGKSDACGLFCNVLNIGNRNYFSCIATGDYTVSVYTSVGGALISSQNVASNVQCNWQIDWSACTHNVDADTRQAYVEITPQSGQSLTLVGFNTNHPAESSTASAPNIVSAYGVLPALTNATGMFYSCFALQSVTLPALPALTNATNMFYACFALQSVTLPALPALTNATGMFYSCYALQSVTLPVLPALPALTNATNMFYACLALQSVTLPALPALTNATNMFGTATAGTCLRSIRKLSTNNLGSVFANATTFILRYTAVQEAEALSWVASLGSSANTITFDLRSNPFSTSMLVTPAILAKFPNATVLMV